MLYISEELTSLFSDMQRDEMYIGPLLGKVGGEKKGDRSWHYYPVFFKNEQINIQKYKQ